MARIEIGGAVLRLLSERAVFVESERALLVADVHLGKAQSFRRLGVPVPEGTTGGTLARLSRAVAATGATRLVVLGDLLHAALATPRARGSEVRETVAAWRRAHATLQCTLVRGNHDARAGDPPPDWQFDVVDEPWALGPLALCHAPRSDQAGRYVLAGHLHPAVHLSGRGPGHLRLPCFHFGAAVGVLPAFGEFTGGVGVRAAPGERIFAIADDEVREMPAVPARVENAEKAEQGQKADKNRPLHCPPS